MNGPLGVVTGGSLTTGIDIKLDAGTSVEDMAVGRYVTVRGKKHLFFGMITDIQLAVTDPAITSDPPAGNDIFVTEVLSGTATYGALHVLPMLTIGDATSVVPGPQPVKTVPSHFSNVNLATDADMASVFGGEDRERYWIGNPLDMDQALPKSGRIREAFQWHLRQERYGQDLSHSHPAHRHAPEKQSGQSHL
jgi:hypothetical protein